MHVVRILFVPILVVILLFLSSVGVVVTALSQTITDRDQIKTAISHRSVYDSLKQVTTEGTLFDFEDSQNQYDTEQAGSSDANREAVQQLVNRYLTVDFYNRATTALVDSFYDWFEGKTAQPQFAIPITQDKNEFKNFIADTFVQRYNSLPPCPQATVIDDSFNPLEATCQVPGINSDQVRALIDEQASQPQFQQLFENATLNSDSLASGINPEDSQNIQNGFAVLKNLSWIFPLLFVVTIGLIMLILFNRNRSFKTVSFTILPPATLVLVFSLIGKSLVENRIRRALDSAPSQHSDPINNLITEVVSVLYAAVNNRILLISGLLVLVSASLLGINFWLNKRDTQATTKTSLAGR